MDNTEQTNFEAADLRVADAKYSGEVDRKYVRRSVPWQRVAASEAIPANLRAALDESDRPDGWDVPPGIARVALHGRAGDRPRLPSGPQGWEFPGLLATEADVARLVRGMLCGGELRLIGRNIRAEDAAKRRSEGRKPATTNFVWLARSFFSDSTGDIADGRLWRAMFGDRIPGAPRTFALGPGRHWLDLRLVRIGRRRDALAAAAAKAKAAAEAEAAAEVTSAVVDAEMPGQEPDVEPAPRDRGGAPIRYPSAPFEGELRGFVERNPQANKRRITTHMLAWSKDFYETVPSAPWVRGKVTELLPRVKEKRKQT